MLGSMLSEGDSDGAKVPNEGDETSGGVADDKTSAAARALAVLSRRQSMKCEKELLVKLTGQCSEWSRIDSGW